MLYIISYQYLKVLLIDFGCIHGHWLNNHDGACLNEWRKDKLFLNIFPFKDS